MRRLTTLTLTVLLSCLASTASAGILMTEEEMLEASTLVVRGAITHIACDGEPVDNGNSIVTPYLATLTVAETEKGDETLESVTLPFAHVSQFNPEDFLSCGWTPHYRKGHSGLYYLVTGSSTDHHTLVDAAAFLPDEDSSPEELPSCEEPEEEVLTCEDVTCGPCETCEGGECQPTEGLERVCAEDADCEGGEACVMSEDGCESSCEPWEGALACEDTGGTWDECAASSCDSCDDCIPGCLCAEGEFDPSLGCVTPSEETPSEETPSEETPSEETPSEESPSADAAEATNSEGGCSGGGSNQTGFALLFSLTLLGVGRLHRRVTA